MCPCIAFPHHVSSWLRRQPAHQPRTLLWSISTPCNGFSLHLQTASFWVSFYNSIDAICKTKYASHKHLHKAKLRKVAGCDSVLGTKGTSQRSTGTEAGNPTKQNEKGKMFSVESRNTKYVRERGFSRWLFFIIIVVVVIIIVVGISISFSILQWACFFFLREN